MNVPDYYCHNAILFQTILEQAVNVLDCCSQDTILYMWIPKAIFWTILECYMSIPGHYSCTTLLLLTDHLGVSAFEIFW